jgi:hypothetical protein
MADNNGYAVLPCSDGTFMSPTALFSISSCFSRRNLAFSEALSADVPSYVLGRVFPCERENPLFQDQYSFPEFGLKMNEFYDNSILLGDSDDAFLVAPPTSMKKGCN